MENRSWQTHPVVKVIAVGVVVVLAACLVMFYFDVGPFFQLKASWHAREVADLNGDRGGAALKLEAMGPRAYPAMRWLLQQDDHTTRDYGLKIIRKLRLVQAADDILEMLKHEDYDRNRTYALLTIQDLVPKRPEYLKCIVPYLDDPVPEVRNTMCEVMQGIVGEYLPGRSPEWWKQWWVEHKDEIEQKCKASSQQSAGTAKSEAVATGDAPKAAPEAPDARPAADAAADAAPVAATPK